MSCARRAGNGALGRYTHAMPRLLAGLRYEAIRIDLRSASANAHYAMKAATDRCDSPYSTLTPRQNAT